MSELWQELLRRRVVRAAVSYLAAAFIALQAVDVVLSGLPVPGWLHPAALAAALAGFVITLALAWAFDLRHGSVVRAGAPGDSPPRRGRMRMPAMVLLGLVVLTGAGWLTASSLRGDAPLDPELVAVFPFRTSSTQPLVVDLSSGMVDLLAAKLTGAAATQVVDPRTSMVAWRRAGGIDADEGALRAAARDMRAGRMLLGSIVAAGDEIVISASLAPIGWGRRVEHSVTGPADSITRLVDRLTASLLSLGAGEDEDRLEALTSTSLPALRAYLLGRAAYRGGEYRVARDHFFDALLKDSTFALAAMSAELAAGWAATPPAERTRARRLAHASRDRLAAADRLLLDALVGADFPAYSTAADRCSAWNRAHEALPTDAEVTYGAADCMFHYGRLHGHADHVQRARVLFERSVAADSTFVPNLEHLIAIAAMSGDSALAARIRPLLAAALRRDTAAEHTRWHLAVAVNDTAALRTLAADFGDFTRNRLALMASVHLAGGRHLAWADSLFRVLERPAGGAPDFTTLRSLMLRGRPLQAAAVAPAISGAVEIVALTLGAMYGEFDPATVPLLLSRGARTFKRRCRPPPRRARPR